MRLLFIISTIFVSLNFVACGQEGQKTTNDQIAKNVNAEEFHKIFTEKGGQMIDVRTDGEVAQGYITGAVQIDFYGNTFDSEVEKLDKNKPVFVYCAVGGRSGKAMNKMKKMGFKEVYNLSGGYGTWQSAGYDVSK